VTQRLERLERENRWLKQISGVAMIGLAAVLLMGQSFPSTFKQLDVERLMLLDGRGNPRAMLSTVDGLPVLVMTGADGKARIIMNVRSNGYATVTLLEGLDKEEQSQVSLAMAPNGASGLQFHDPAGKVRARLGTRPANDSPSLILFDKAGMGRLTLDLAPNGEPGLGLRDAAEKVIWKAP
jgi:hypothetical protein